MENQIQGTENPDTEDAPPTEQKSQKKSNRPLLIIIGTFIALVIFVFLTQKKTPIDWITDYDTAVQMARQQNKPMLLMFYKQFAPMYVDAKNNTYSNQKVKQFVESNFIPVAIDCDAQPDLARKFNIGYYPTHYVKHPDHTQLFGPRKGWDPPSLFIKEMTKLLNRMKESMR